MWARLLLIILIIMFASSVVVYQQTKIYDCKSFTECKAVI